MKKTKTTVAFKGTAEQEALLDKEEKFFMKNIERKFERY